MIIVRSKKQILKCLLAAVCAVALGAAIRFNAFQNVFSTKNDNERYSVVIDAGHGLPDGGAVGIDGTVEQEINIDVAKKVCEVLEGKGISVIMTRSDDNCLALGTHEGKSIRRLKVEDMRLRKKIINNSGAELFISIHMNCFTNEKADGLMMLYDRNHPEIKETAEKMQERIARVTGAKPHEVRVAQDSLYLMKNASVASILAECGFISNREEEQKLKTEEYRAKIAWAIAKTAEEYLLNN